MILTQYLDSRTRVSMYNGDSASTNALEARIVVAAQSVQRV